MFNRNPVKKNMDRFYRPDTHKPKKKYSRNVKHKGKDYEYNV